MKLIRSCKLFLLPLILAGLVVENISARELLATALAKIPSPVLEQFIHHGERELVVLLDESDITEQVHLIKARSGLQFENQAILETRRKAYADLKSTVLLGFPTVELDLIYHYESLPMMFVRVATSDALYRLLENDDVIQVFENSVHSLSLVESLPLIGQVETFAAGHGGQGTTVAVLDTGVDYKKAAFGPCVSPGIPDDCKVVFARDFAPDDTVLDMNGHGTNVAAIVLGVAPETRIAALDVFTGIGIYTADVIDAIDWVISNQAVFNIVAMNLSFGTDLFDDVCHNSWATTPFANARAVGVVPIVASGNDYEAAKVKNPACAPGAISVGAVHDTRPEGPGYRACGSERIDKDIVACFSNSASFLDLLAPGVDITAAELTKSGTSMAVPHVAGAYAVLKGESAYPEGSIESTIERLKVTGKQVLDDRNGMMFPRIDLEAALFELLPDQVPEISGFDPVKAAEGEVLQIHGSGFRGVNEVLIGGTAAHGFKVDTSQLIRVNVGSGSSGEVRVATSLGSDSESGFTFINSVRETEPNNNTVQANPVLISGERLAGGLSSDDDLDFFRFGLDVGQVTFSIKPVRSMCCAKYVQLTLKDLQGKVLASKRVDGNVDTPVTLDATIEQRAAYYLVVSQTPERDAVFDKDYQVTVPENTYPNMAPAFVSTPPDVVFAGQTYSYSLEADDADNDAVYFSVVSGPPGMVIDQQSHTIHWSPVGDQVGLNEIELLVNDDFGGSGIQTFSIAVIDSSLLQINATDGTFKNHVRIGFNPVEGASTHRVFRCDDATGPCGSPIGFTKSGLFNDMRAVPGILYHYRIRACYRTKCGPLSAADTGFASIAPDQPTGIRATDGIFQDRVRVTFNPVGDAVVYRVFRCLDKGQTCGAPIGYPKGSSFDDKKGNPGVVYVYRVKACNTQHCGKFSVANTGHSSLTAGTEMDIQIRSDIRPIPVLGNMGRWLLILMVLGYGFSSGYRAYRAGKLDLF